MNIPSLFRSFALSALCICLASAASIGRAALVGYWTLDNLTTGIQNQGSDLQSDLTAVGAPSESSAGIVGSAITLNGASYLTTSVANNAAADLSNYPVSLSIWIKTLTKNADSPAFSALSITRNTASSGFVNLGAFVTSGGNDSAYLGTNNGTGVNFSPVPAPGANPTNAVGTNWINDGFWHHIAATVAPSLDVALYIDGKLVRTDTTTQTFNDAINTISIGALVRTSAGDFVTGSLDDAGLLDSILSTADVALINGLGHTGNVGLNWLDEAQALAAGPVNGTGSINGFTFMKVAGQSGVTGFQSGTMTGGNAYILYDGTGGFAIQQVPEPSSIILLSVSVAGLYLCGWRKKNS